MAAYPALGGSPAGRRLKGFYQGNSTLYHANNLSAWADSGGRLDGVYFRPVLGIALRGYALFRRWVEEERLSFPLAYLPMR